MTRHKGYLMEDQVQGLVRDLLMEELKRKRRRSRIARLLELGSLAITGGLSTFLLVWQL